MKIAITGASGLVGQALTNTLEQNGHTVIKIVRTPILDPLAVQWDPQTGLIQSEKLEGLDAIIHLAGEGIANSLWTKAKKERIYSSRINGTRLIADSISLLKSKPKVLLSASAVGIYGDRPNETLSEASSPGSGFLPKTCVDWELATQAASDAGIRVCHLRIGIVLDKKGGALEKMLLPFQLGLGGRLGSGTQHMSWISLNDLVRLFQAALTDEGFTGAVNAVSPSPITNREFTRQLGAALHRLAVIPVPALLLKVLFREFASEGLLADCAVVPEKTLKLGFNFQDESLSEFLCRHLK